MLSVDTSQTVADLEKYILDTERRLKNMVVGFAYELTVRAVQVTPIGNAEILSANPDELTRQEQAYYGLYVGRAAQYPSIAPMQVGYHKSAWRFSKTGQFELLDGDASYDSEESVYSQAQSQYRLGNTFYIGAKGFPNANYGDTFKAFEAGAITAQTPNGILEPAWNALASTYKVDLVRYYNEG